MTYEHIAYEADGPMLTVTLNRPDKLNAYTALMGAEIEDAFLRADGDDDIRAIIVTGAGRASAPAPTSPAAPTASTPQAQRRGVFAAGASRAARGGGFVEAIYNCRKPSIAAINGPAVGVGITCPCRWTSASRRAARRSASFSRAAALCRKRAAPGSCRSLSGLPQALRWCLSGRVFEADEAQEGGLVSEVVAPADLLARAKEIALEIAENTAPVSIAMTRQMLWQFAGAHPFELLEMDGAAVGRARRPADVKEGVRVSREAQAAFPGKVSKDMPSQYPWWNSPKK